MEDLKKLRKTVFTDFEKAQKERAKNRNHKKRKKLGYMTKKELEQFFGHKFPQFSSKKKHIEVKFDSNKNTYTCFFDKNDQLCEILPLDDESKEVLNHLKGKPFQTVNKLLKEV